MSQPSQHPDRGMVGHTPALTSRSDEAFLDFVSDARNLLMHEQWYAVCELGNAALKQAGLADKEHVWPGRVDEMREVLADKGWRIDLEAFHRRNGKDVAFAIPSPGRRESSNWVIETIPLIKGRRAAKTAVG